MNINIPYTEAQKKVNAQITMPLIRFGILRAYNGDSKRADVELTGSGASYLKNVAVSRDLYGAGDSTSSTIMCSLGSKVVVVSPDTNNSGLGVIIAVY